MQVLIGALVLALLALGVTGYQLKGALEDAATSRQDALQAEQRAGEQRQQAELMLERLGRLDTAVSGLAHADALAQAQLAQALAGIENITKTEGDSDEAMACLDVRVPAQLADGVR